MVLCWQADNGMRLTAGWVCYYTNVLNVSEHLTFVTLNFATLTHVTVLW